VSSCVCDVRGAGGGPPGGKGSNFNGNEGRILVKTLMEFSLNSWLKMLQCTNRCSTLPA